MEKLVSAIEKTVVDNKKTENKTKNAQTKSERADANTSAINQIENQQNNEQTAPEMTNNNYRRYDNSNYNRPNQNYGNSRYYNQRTANYNYSGPSVRYPVNYRAPQNYADAARKPVRPNWQNDRRIPSGMNQSQYLGNNPRYRESQESNQNGANPPDLPINGRCYYCDKFGHMAKVCRSRQRDQATGNLNSGAPPNQAN